MRMRVLLVVGLALAGFGLAAEEAISTSQPLRLEDVESVVGPPQGTPLEGAALAARTEEVGGLLRCPVCQGLSVADSPAGMAVNMKHQVRDLLAVGYEEEQILSYFERSYGEFVRLEPPMRGVNWLVWLAPLGGLLVGGLIVGWVLRSPAKPATAGPDPTAAETPQPEGPGPDALPEDPELAPYVLKVRELAYGWPGGVSAQNRADES